MKTRQQQKEEQKTLKIIAKLYAKIDALKLENQMLKKQLKQLTSA